MSNEASIDYNGILIIDKPTGITSHDVVYKVRKLLNIKRVGHAGTLDKLATGVLVVLVGKATKKSNTFINQDKTYQAQIKFGISTETDDAEGKLIKEASCNFTKNKLENELKNFIGPILQKPPAYSAIKVGGRKLYELARKGKLEDKHLKERKVNIYSIELENFSGGDHPLADLVINCSKGTYIRSIARDLGEKLGCGAYLNNLTRIASGDFTIDKAITLDKLEQIKSTSKIAEVLIPIND